MFPVTMMSLQCNEFLELDIRVACYLNRLRRRERWVEGESRWAGEGEEEGSSNPHPNRLSATSLCASSFSDLPAEVRPLQPAPFGRLQ